MEHTHPSIGVIGLGIIGSRVAEKLREAERHVYVWSPTPRPVPNFVGSPAEVASLTKTIQLFVRDGEALVETIEAMRDSLTHEHVVINCATVSPEHTRRAATLVHGVAAGFLDCPFTGSKVAAGNGQLVYYVGGNTDLLEEVRADLEVSSKTILHVGEIGHATILKIVTNMITASTVEVLAEALALTNAKGLTPDKLARAIELNACNSGVVGLKLQSMAERDFSPHFSLKNMLKDAGYALEMAEAKGLELPVHRLTSELMEAAMTGDQPDADFSILYQRYL